MTLRRTGAVLLAVSAAAASLTCTDDLAPDVRPAALVEVAGDDQVALVNQPLPESLVVRVDDAQGQPVSGIDVVWTYGGGGGVSPAATRTGQDGHAAVARRLGAIAGRQSTMASVADLPPVVFNAVAEAGPVPHLVIVTQPSGTGTSGTPLAQQPVIRVLDG